MIKTVKVNKRMRLDELIKYVWEHDGSLFKRCMTVYFHTKDNKIVTFEESGECSSVDWFDPDDLFTVEIEEEITEDTEFEELYTMMSFKSVYSHDAKTIKEVKESFDTSGDLEFLHQIYAMIEGKLELIWEREE